MSAQLALFADPALPEGFRYQPEFLSPEEEAALIARFADLPLKPFEFQQYLGKRRVVYFGYRYDYQRGVMDEAADLPAWLIPPAPTDLVGFGSLRPAQNRPGCRLGIEPRRDLGPDRPQPLGGLAPPGRLAGDRVAGRAVPAPTRPPAGPGDRWRRVSLVAEPRSIYLLRGPARTEWQHSIPPVAERRYSITFRTLR